MSRRKQWEIVWTVVLIIATLSPFASSRPSTDAGLDATTTKNQLNNLTKQTESPNRSTNGLTSELLSSSASPLHTSAPRDVKNATPVIGESMKMVASQLLHSTKAPAEVALVEDTRTPPKMKNHITSKNKTRSKPEKVEAIIENSHAGIALPVTMEELEKDSSSHNNDISKESSTSHEGISTWILLSNPSSTVKPSKDMTKIDIGNPGEDGQKKPKPNNSKNKPKKPQHNNVTKVTQVKRPIIASTNKSDLVAGGSAMSENVFNKIKATVLANVQKHKNAAINRTTTSSPITPSTVLTSNSNLVTKKDFTTKAPSATTASIDSSTATEKAVKLKKKKKNKNKNKTHSSVNQESARLPMEPKEQEIELEVSTPPTTTKKPKRTSTKRKKIKTKKRKPSTTSQIDDSETSNTKITNSTKLTKPATKVDNPISTQIYNYLSREVIPTVGVGIVGLAGLVGLASYFLYPFAGPVRRVLEVDKKDDLYRHNAEEYANDGNGQAEEEMLGTVLAGIPAKSNRVNPYVNQTPVRQQAVIEPDQNLRYRHVSASSDINNYNTHYSQQKTGIAHAAVYSDPINYSSHYENQNVYPMEIKHTVYANENQNTQNKHTGYTNEKQNTQNKHTVYANENQNTYNAYSPVEPIYAVPQTGPSGPSSYGSETSNSVVYGVKPTQESSFEPVYPFEGQVFSETTTFPMTYPPTSMYLGSNNESENPSGSSFNTEVQNNENKEPQFVVGNVPKELIQPVTPAVVPEHGPRNLDRKKRSISDSLEEVLRKAKDENKDIFISNEIDEALGVSLGDNVPLPTKTITSQEKTIVTQKPTNPTTDSEVNDAKSSSSDNKEQNTTLFPVHEYKKENVITVNEYSSKAMAPDLATSEVKPHAEDEIVESISTVPFDSNSFQGTTEPIVSNEEDFTTKTFRVYEVFPSSMPSTTPKTPELPSNLVVRSSTNTPVEQTHNENTLSLDNISSVKADYSSTGLPPTESNVEVTSTPQTDLPVKYSTTDIPPNMTSTLAYPKDSSFISFLKRLFEFKFKLGMSILQTTSDSLTRYLRSMEGTVRRVAKASGSQ